MADKSNRKGKKKLKDLSLYRKICIIIIMAGIITAVFVAVNKASQILHPTAESLIKGCLTDEIKKNSVRGRISISNDATVDLSDTMGKGVTSDLNVTTTGSSYVIDNDRMYVKGSSDIKYADLAESLNYFTVYKDLRKNKQYVYYSDSEPGNDYMKDYEKWAAIDTGKSKILNFPKELRACLYTLEDKELEKKRNGGYTVTGKLDTKTMSGLIRYIIQTDTKNTCLMNGIRLGEGSARTVKAIFNDARELTHVYLHVTGADAGSNIKIKKLELDFSVEKNKEALVIPSSLKDVMLDTDFSISVPESDIKTDVENTGSQPASFEDLKLKFNGKNIDSFNDIRNTVMSDKDMDAQVVSDESDTVFVPLKTDNNARVYLYTDPGTGKISQVEFDSSYAKHKELPVTLMGLAPGDGKDTVTQIIGTPASSTSGSGIETMTYSIGENNGYLLTLTFYEGDALVNSGLQKINIRKRVNEISG